MVVADEKNIKSDLIPGIASGFCGGVSRTRGMCGAVSGAIMAVNMIMGRQSPDQSQEENYLAVQKLLAGFKKEFGSINCWELTGCDLATEAGQNTFRDKNIHERCTRFVQEATRLVMTLTDQ
ncbi:MAG: C_GCAxxG_C_C family protein [Candidatus Aminicenantes bacterium]|nr:C_GCAxxG_C_C family protein [Candidatus Aminicenantes bacterium]